MDNILHYGGGNHNIRHYYGCLTEESTEKQYDIFSKEAYLLPKEPDSLESDILYNELPNGSTHIAIKKNPGNTIMYLFFHVVIDEDIRIIADLLFPAFSKMWMDEKLVTIIGANMGNNSLDSVANQCVIDLHKGTNNFVIEIYHPREENMFLLQFVNYKYHSSHRLDTFATVGKRIKYKNLNFIGTSAFWNNDGKYECMILSNSPTELNFNEYRVYNLSGRVIYRGVLKLGCKLVLDKKLFNKLDDDILQITLFCFSWGMVGKRKKYEYQHILTDNVKELITYYKKEYDKHVEWQSNEAVTWKIDSIEKIYEKYGKVSAFWECYDFFQEYCYHEPPKVDRRKKVKPSEINTLIYNSDIDTHSKRIMYRLPKNYDTNKEYPLVMHLSIGTLGYECQLADEYSIANKFIYADITIRGQTLGNCMGEASIFECMHQLLMKFKIDQHRIYLCGASNGGYAAWRMIQKYPHLFAAAFPLAAYPNIRQIQNVSNIPILNMVSDEDYVYRGKTEQLKKELEYYGHYKQYDVHDMLHCQLLKFAVNRMALKWFLHFVSNPYPNEVHFWSNQARYKKSFWITLGNISLNCMEMFVHAYIVNKNTIKIEVAGTESLSISLPPRLSHTQLLITINHQVFNIDEVAGDNLYFIRTSNMDEFQKVDSLSDAIFSCKGIGIVDVYFQPMRIIKPDVSCEILDKTAIKLSKPCSGVNNGFIDVEYPILRANEYKPREKECLIILDYNGNNSMAKRLNTSQYISCYSDRFEYQGQEYVGKYVVMEILPSPFSTGTSVLLVSSNDEKMLVSHIYLRKMILSSDCFDRNIYLNNEALILFNNKFYSIYEWGDILKQVSRR